ncbi:MAG: 2-oxoacid:acceptor oxidoreductase family protein [Bacillota bacterium]
MSNQKEFRLSGAGGQGLILAGIILAEAGIVDDMHAVQTQSYGPEARGGASKSEVILSDKQIDYPKVRKPDLVLALTQAAADKYLTEDSDVDIIIVDEKVDINPKVTYNKLYKEPILKTANIDIGKSIVANIVALGMVVESSKIVTKNAIETAVLNRVPKGTEELNKMALKKGYELIN